MSKQRDVQQMRSEVERLEREVQAELRELPRNFGFRDLESFITALKDAVNGRPREKPAVARASGSKGRYPKAASAPARPAGPTPEPPGERAPTAASAPVSALRVAAPVRPPLGVALAAAVSSAPATEPKKEEPAEVCSTLDEPKKFNAPPPVELLEQVENRAKLRESLQFCHRVLHTSGVRADVWRNWRAFERRAVEVLRAN